MEGAVGSLCEVKQGGGKRCTTVTGRKKRSGNSQVIQKEGWRDVGEVGKGQRGKETFQQHAGGREKRRNPHCSKKRVVGVKCNTATDM